MIIPLIFALVSNLEAAPAAPSPCPTGFNPQLRTLVLYTPNDAPNSRDHILSHYKTITSLLKKKNLQHAIALYQQSNPDHGIFLYALASEADTKAIVALDPLSTKNLFDINYETLVECK